MKIYLDILDEPPLTFLKLKNIEAVDYMSFLFFRERNKNDVLKVIKTEKTKIRKGKRKVIRRRKFCTGAPTARINQTVQHSTGRRGRQTSESAKPVPSSMVFRVAGRSKSKHN